MDTYKYRAETLSAALEARIQEVTHYQINIDNYTLALQKIAALPASEAEELKEFAAQLTNLLASEKLEQKKAKIMLDVIKEQVA